MKVLVTGANGQLGFELNQSRPNNVQIINTDVADLDITDAGAVQAMLAQQQPDWVINAAAYTAVDKAESEPGLADRINHQAAGILAQASHAVNAGIVQISTDFIFNGLAHKPYATDATPEPLSVYGKTKWLGEQAVRQHCDKHLIIRTSWLYSSHGNNFVKTMLKLMSNKDELNIIADQIGTPTWAGTLAQGIWALLNQEARGTLHLSDNGVASWYDFACAIQTQGMQQGLLQQAILVNPIPATQYPTPAARPHFSVMDKTLTEQALGYRLPHWQLSLGRMLTELKMDNQE